MNDLAGRLRDAGTALLGLRGALVAGEPWPLSAAYGTEPEADWGPREVLAHVNEMLGYWPRELASVLAGDPATAVPFGRVASDANRIGRIGRDRERPAGELLDAIDASLADAVAFLEGLTPADLERRGAHPARGELTVAQAVEPFLTGHLEGHVVQLREILARSAPA
jgi:DinB family protein